MSLHPRNWLAAFVLLAACSLEPPNGQMACASDEDCPPGWVCRDVCYRSSDDFPDTDGSSDSGGDTVDSTTGSSSEPTACEAAAVLDARVVCCPAPFPRSCDSGAWSFADTPADAATAGCCTADLGVAVVCTSTGEWIPRTCSSPCAFEGDQMTCDGTYGNACAKPVIIDEVPSAWYGHWSDFGQTFAPTNECGSGGNDAWFQVALPGSGQLTVTSPDVTNLRQVVGCSDSSCVAWAYSPDGELHIEGAPHGTVYVVVSDTSFGDRAFGLTFAP